MKPSAIITVEGNNQNKLYIDSIIDIDKFMAFLYGFNSAWINGLDLEIEGNQVFGNFKSGSKKLVGLLQSASFHEYITDGFDLSDGVPLVTNEYGWDLIDFDYQDEISLKITIHLNGMCWVKRPKAFEL